MLCRFTHDGRKYYMTAEQMVHRFPGVADALAGYWEAKRQGSISEFKIMQYFSAHGHIGPLRECLYHFLPRRMFRMLMELKAAGKLHTFFF